MHGSHAEEQQAGTAGGTESISMDCSLLDEQALGGDPHLPAKGLPPSKAGVSGSSPLLGNLCFGGKCMDSKLFMVWGLAGIKCFEAVLGFLPSASTGALMAG